jgi:hypothetical protein
MYASAVVDQFFQLLRSVACAPYLRLLLDVHCNSQACESSAIDFTLDN